MTCVSYVGLVQQASLHLYLAQYPHDILTQLITFDQHYAPRQQSLVRTLEMLGTGGISSIAIVFMYLVKAKTNS